MRSSLFLLLFLLCSVASITAEPMPEADIPFRITSWDVRYEVNGDGSFVETQKWSRVVLQENALEGAKNGSVTFSTSVAKGEILEAYTVKKSGERLDAPRDSYQVSSHDGYNDASPLYSDETTISVVFPNLAVGDTTVFASRVSNAEGIFPGHFSVTQGCSPFTAFDRVSFEIIAPAAMNLRTQAFSLTAQKPEVKEGKQVLRWTYQNRTPEKWTPADDGIYSAGDEPSLYVSTFRSYEEIAKAYGARATPKALATERVARLAGEIVGDKTTPEAQARALYDWVAKNISYGGNCIGIGAVVPRDLSVVLDNKLGDCKDHATLLQALLASRNIASDQALVSAGGSGGYRLPDVPVVSAVNHVINYLPGLDLFLDSTSADTPFGMLPMNLGEKPALLVSQYREGLKMPTTARGHAQTMKTRVRITPDGSATGEVEVSVKGLPALAARSILRAMPSGQDGLLAERMLASQGMHGTGILVKDDPAPLLDTYALRMSFSVRDYVGTDGPVGVAVKPVISSFFAIEKFTAAAYEPEPRKPQTCGGGSSREEYVLEFPENLKIVAIPKDYELSTPILDYRATYRKSDNTLTVRRELNDKTASNICSPQLMAEYKKAALAVVRDLKAQVLVGN